jgi:hypothetical protein
VSQVYPRLATVVLGTTSPAYWIGTVANDPAEAAASRVPFLLTIRFGAGSERREIALDTLDTSKPVWTGTRHVDEGDTSPPLSVTVRPTRESDAMVAYSMSAAPSIPLPVPVLDYMHNVEFTLPTLYAMSEDDGFVATMMLNSDEGLYVRYSNLWHRLLDDDVVDGLSVDEVDASALDMFDQFDRAGQLVHITAMPRSGQPIEAPPAQAADPAAAPQPMVSAAQVRTVPMLASADDLPAAIAAARHDPDLQWWVERRVKALGLEADLPWA